MIWLEKMDPQQPRVPVGFWITPKIYVWGADWHLNHRLWFLETK